MMNASDQGRTQQVTLQYNPTTQKHYLLTSFTAGYQSGAEALYYIDELESGTWAGQFTGTGAAGWVPTYTTFTSDQDFDFNATLTSFTSNGFPISIELGWHDFQQMFGIPETVFAGSTAAYTGGNTCPTPTPTGSVSPTPTPSPSATPTPEPKLQRWGDYNSLIWDPSLTSTSGEKGLFWSVLEFTNGGADQSTIWTPFNDALPFFVGSTQTEGECSGPGTTCKVTITAPAGVSNGDLVLVALDLPEPAAHLPRLPDSSWTLLSASNKTGSPQQIASSGCSGACTETSWLAAHIFGSVPNDLGSYTFSHFINANVEFIASLVVYRGAGQDLSRYTGYGFTQNGIKSSFSTAAISPPSETKLAAMVFADGGCEFPESTEANEAFTAPTGTPALTVETSLTPAAGWLVADAAVPAAGQSYGPYTLKEGPTGSCTNIGAIWLGWEVAIPEQ